MKKELEIVVTSLREGRCIVLVDDTDREDEADFLCSGQLVTGELINEFVTQGRGLVCVPMESQRLIELRLPQMVSHNEDRWGTQFTVSVDHKDTSTGISAFERAKTIQALANGDSTHEDFRRPGHIFPLAGRKGGTLERFGHTEASLDLLKIAQLAPVGVICEILSKDGHMLRGKNVHEFCRQKNIPKITVQDIVEYRLSTEDLLQEIQREQTARGTEIWYREISGQSKCALFLRHNWQLSAPADQIPLFVLSWYERPICQKVLDEHPVVALIGETPRAFEGSKDGLWTHNLQRCFFQKVREQFEYAPSTDS